MAAVVIDKNSANAAMMREIFDIFGSVSVLVGGVGPRTRHEISMMAGTARLRATSVVGAVGIEPTHNGM